MAAPFNLAWFAVIASASSVAGAGMPSAVADPTKRKYKQSKEAKYLIFNDYGSDDCVIPRHLNGYVKGRSRPGRHVWEL
jgi:hypothetical protein